MNLNEMVIGVRYMLILDSGLQSPKARITMDSSKLHRRTITVYDIGLWQVPWVAIFRPATW